MSAGSARLLPGGPVAERVFAEVAEGVAALRAAGVVPALATVLVGDDDASAGYIRIKSRQAAELGFASPHVHLPASATQADLHRVLRDLNDDAGVHAVLVQHPVPGHLDYDRALQVLDPDSDVDGMHPVNMGRLALGLPGPVPCTPAGIEALLAFHGVPVAGREVVVLGRGATLGRPLAMLLAQKRPTANAAVTVVHTGVADWPRYTRRAEILVAAAGVPGIVRPEHVRPGAVVVGGGVRYEGRRLLPDVDESCARVAGAITPRVGGVGPTTVAMLFRNALRAAQRAAGRGSAEVDDEGAVVGDGGAGGGGGGDRG
ncbi:bifunctional 5,10-methylenetetrahydrofolate dehydrogenase/5,10-methenyltetrahydrofolate cyclohydrolase [Micromonospora wenchangensis]|uniref:bifunctional 5,10-methylenetetrahydrofolate dehydrogenase/5,10-methenyltetrahydrofolate cyclohydrolase n=1 Tax=Micromonospora wenchangensis TaxID=1185415 RepID=UPI001FEA84CF|nr:tetrahydrofolate dehydrogenase/cyclohydrolase catalytic domain-containing protein [Micromonospora wenchangensis]